MYNRPQNIVIGIIGGAAALALLLTWLFSGSSPVPPLAPVVSESSAPQASEAGESTAAAPAESDPIVSSEIVEARPRIIVKTDVIPAGGRQFSIGLALRNENGHSVRVTDVVRTRQPAPKLRIVDEAGKVLLDASFQYG